MALDPSEYTVKELREAVSDIGDPDELAAILDAEREGRDRKTARERIQARLNALASEGAESAGEPDDGVEDASDDAAGEAAEESPWPACGADVPVVFDPTGAGGTGGPDPPISGHDTIHLPDEQGEPRCGADAGAKMETVYRSSLPEDIDECSYC